MYSDQRLFACVIAVVCIGLFCRDAVAVEVLSPVNIIQPPDPPSTDGFADRFGSSVALFSNTLVVGMPGEDLGGVSNGGQGAAHVFSLVGDAPTHVAKLVAPGNPNSQYFEGFGYRVAASEGAIAVSSEGGSGLSGVHVFGVVNDVWSPVSSFERSGEYHLGEDLAFSDDRLLVGSPAFNSVITGKGLIYKRAGDSWIEEAMLETPDGAVRGWLGTSVSLDGDTAVLGSPGYGTSNPDEALVYRKGAAGWEFEAAIPAPRQDVDSLFGTDVAIFGNVLVVGAPSDEGQPYSFRPGDGAAYVYERRGREWSLIDRLVPSIGNDLSGFGSHVAIDGDFIAVSAPGYMQTFVYHKTDSGWNEVFRTDTQGFGSAVARLSDISLERGLLVQGRTGASASRSGAEQAFIYSVVPEPSGLTLGLWGVAYAVMASRKQGNAHPLYVGRLGWWVAGVQALAGAPSELPARCPVPWRLLHSC